MTNLKFVSRINTETLINSQYTRKILGDSIVNKLAFEFESIWDNATQFYIEFLNSYERFQLSSILNLNGEHVLCIMLWDDINEELIYTGLYFTETFSDDKSICYININFEQLGEL